MNILRLLTVPLLLLGCVNDSSPSDGRLMGGPGIETGYQRVADPDACDEQLSCETATVNKVRGRTRE